MITTPPKTFSSFLFDLDGTLADTAPDLAASVDIMLRRLGRPKAGEDGLL